MARFPGAGSAGFFSAPARAGQANLIMHLRFGGEAGLSSSVEGGGVGGEVGFTAALLPQANVIQRLRPRPASTDFSGGPSFALS